MPRNTCFGSKFWGSNSFIPKLQIRKTYTSDFSLQLRNFL